MNTRVIAAIFCMALFLPSALRAKDHVLTIGGGYTPAGNQISLERNVIFFNKLLAEQLPPDLSHDLYFADGESPNPDLQFEPKDQSIPKANLIAASLLGSTKYIKLRYRNNELKNVRGPSSPAELEKWFTETGAKLTAGDRLILYVTAHGSRGPSKGNRSNTKIYMWNNQTVEASKLADLIATLPEGVSVVTIMVQCYSGGFANLIFENADPKKDQTTRNICGFYATVHDRVAAGCTADINEEDYDEYSSHFWAALRGKTRVEKDINQPDYDGDGQISFEEAHAYTLLTSKTLDIPIKTSGAFLRRHSKVGDSKNPKLLHPEKTPYFQLLSHARPSDLAVLDHLSQRLSLSTSDRGTESKKKAEEIQKTRKELDTAAKEKKKTIDAHRKEMARDLKNRWPQLSNLLSPEAVELIASQSEDFIRAAEGHPKFKEWVKLNKERNKLEKERFELEKQWAHHKRFYRVLENIALAANIEEVAESEAVARFQQLRDAESSFLVPAQPQPAKVEPAPASTAEAKKESPEEKEKSEAAKKPTKPKTDPAKDAPPTGNS